MSVLLFSVFGWSLKVEQIVAKLCIIRRLDKGGTPNEDLSEDVLLRYTDKIQDGYKLQMKITVKKC